MARRRLIVVAIGVALALGAAWWLSADPLTPEERRLVGTWRHRDPRAPDRTHTLVLGPDRGVWYDDTDARREPPRGWWAVRGGGLAVDPEPTALRRAFRPLLRLAGRSVGSAQVFRFETSAGEFVVIQPDGTRTTWTRAPAD